ncbi:MAG: ABC transporter permease [Thermomicrobiales bacterium]|nr:ABC transporter permease [Thermomicrobiales bacterium]MCO5220163.1 ABC transporter permease [Thermomicrobiales bacterium]
MLQFVLRRVIWLIPVIIVVSGVTFALMYRAPGGPWDLEKPLPPATVARLNEKFGLDKATWLDRDAVQVKVDEGVRNPIVLGGALLDTQFFNYLSRVFRGDLGPTYASQGTETVQQVIRNKFPISLRLGLVAVTFAVLVGIPLGVISAMRQNSFIDYACMFLSTLGIAVPTFVSGLVLLIILSQRFGISPIRRPEEWHSFFSTAYILPGIVLGLGTTAYITRLTRSSVLEIKEQDFVRTARAKGLSRSPVTLQHILRNALLPVITILGPAAADLITGSIIIETIFGAPGLGSLFVTSIGKRDYSTLVGITIFYASLIAIANILVDISYGILDPRIRTTR